MDAEGAFRDAQMAVAKIDAGDMNELALKACLSGIYDTVRMRSGVAWPLGRAYAAGEAAGHRVSGLAPAVRAERMDCRICAAHG
jgi:hypothetical protein